ncbi:hypothetical protein [Pseudonocardia acaciae]|uniref:hypothetical protein n=1 Tax=Pseudonocardia acaciae TaxID=551276 RepID=UPI00048B59FE|nr:hypothetical protein [Pseudonocardia acaciae]
MDAVPSGSCLALWDCVSTSKAMRAVEAAYARTGAVRDVDLLAGCFDGWTWWLHPGGRLRRRGPQALTPR